MSVIQGLIGSDYTINKSNTGYLYTFYSDQPGFTFDKSYSIQYAVVNGGSGGQGGNKSGTTPELGGNGGSGGAVTFGNININNGDTYSITVGSGGVGGVGGGGAGGAGGVSSFDSISPINVPASGGTGTKSTSSNQSVLAGTIGTNVILNNTAYKLGGGGCGGTSENTTLQPVPECVAYGGAGIQYGNITPTNST